ncbi:hypothetical protein S7711_00057 [Stachybotrys chartarum IBT 7711]|uniref:Uncharacterized protein n=1 Tax=Stachybotrys chartarum (strain CBS 109288 / IBT 7711) TaxID=1280523 RepID=A0A084B3B0_STACB|nr:hypothetical protein S7711_00057 [Stachybotrys chartarum IBT 7711]
MPETRNQNKKQYGQPSEEALEANSQQRHDAIWPVYEEYMAGKHTSSEDLATKVFAPLQLVPSSDLDVNQVRSASDDSVINVDVCRYSDPWSTNFMGWHQGQKCFVFKGETRLFDDFLAFTTELLKAERVLLIFKAPFSIRVPRGGLPAGMSYEEFAGHVETVEYAMWLQDSVDDDSDGESPATLDPPGSNEKPAVEAEAPEINSDDVALVRFSESQESPQTKVDAAMQDVAVEGPGQVPQDNVRKSLRNRPRKPVAANKPTRGVSKPAKVAAPEKAVPLAKAAAPNKTASPQMPPNGPEINIPMASIEVSTGPVSTSPLYDVSTMAALEIIRYDASLAGGRYQLRNRSGTIELSAPPLPPPPPPPPPPLSKTASRGSSRPAARGKNQGTSGAATRRRSTRNQA